MSFQKLRITQINCENLFYLPNEHVLNVYNKSEHKLKNLASTIQHLDADIYLLSEVGTKESLDRFNSDFLDNRFITSLIPGNSERSIDLGVLVKPYLSKNIKHGSYKNIKLDFHYPYEEEKDEYLSRDILELRVSLLPDSAPDLIFLFVHLKSQWDREGKDFKGINKRKSEVVLLTKIANKLNIKYPSSKTVLAGDFNGNARKGQDEEFKSIHEDLRFNIFELLDILDIDEKERFTTLHFDKNHKFLDNQFDYFFLSESLKNSVIKNESGVGRYVDQDSRPIPLPTTPWERAQLPSDHLPVILTLKLDEMNT